MVALTARTQRRGPMPSGGYATMLAADRVGHPKSRYPRRPAASTYRGAFAERDVSRRSAKGPGLEGVVARPIPTGTGRLQRELGHSQALTTLLSKLVRSQIDVWRVEQIVCGDAPSDPATSLVDAAWVERLRRGIPMMIKKSKETSIILTRFDTVAADLARVSNRLSLELELAGTTATAIAETCDDARKLAATIAKCLDNLPVLAEHVVGIRDRMRKANRIRPSMATQQPRSRPEAWYAQHFDELKRLGLSVRDARILVRLVRERVLDRPRNA